MKSLIDNLNFCQLLVILWGISMIFDIYLRKPIGAFICACMIVVNLLIEEWIW